MNILILTTHMDTGGIASYVLNLSAGLVRKGHRVVVVSSGGGCVPILEQGGARHVQMDIRVKNEAHPKLWFAVPQLLRLIKEEHVDVIHAQTRVAQVMGEVLSFATGKALITTCHGYFKPRLFRRLFPCWGKAVIAISAAVRQHLIDDLHVPPQRIFLVVNGIDLAQFTLTDEQGRELKRRQWQVQARPVIGIIARLSDVKGIDVLLKAMGDVLRYYPNVLLMIVGEGPQGPALKALAERLGLGIHVRFDPIVNRTGDVLPLFDVFVMPSLQEGLGLSVMEAQAAGIPVVASRVGGLPQLVIHGKTGVLAEPGDPAALAQAIVEMLKDPHRAAVMARAARAHIEEGFDARHMAAATIKVYEQHTRR